MKGASKIILRKNVSGLSESALKRFTLRVAGLAKIKGDVNILITSNRDLQLLNRRFRGKDKPTDVLTFPAAGLGTNLVGEIAISAEMAAANAKVLKHSTCQEIKVLALHGILHLAGYDHERDNGRMARKELALRRKLKLPVSLIERNGIESSAGRSRVSFRGRK